MRSFLLEFLCIEKPWLLAAQLSKALYCHWAGGLCALLCRWNHGRDQAEASWLHWHGAIHLLASVEQQTMTLLCLHIAEGSVRIAPVLASFPPLSTTMHTDTESRCLKLFSVVYRYVCDSLLLMLLIDFAALMGQTCLGLIVRMSLWSGSAAKPLIRYC